MMSQRAGHKLKNEKQQQQISNKNISCNKVDKHNFHTSLFSYLFPKSLPLTQNLFPVQFYSIKYNPQFFSIL